MGSKEEGPSFEEVREMVEASEQDDNEEGAQEAVNGLVSLMENMSAPELDDSLVFTPFLDEIDEIATRCFKTYEGSLGARNADYEQALRLYRTDVVEALRQGFAKQAHSSQDEKRWHDVILGRAYMTLSDTRSEHLPVPLMTGYVLDRIWGEFEAAKDGYTEVSACVCECKLKTHRMLVLDCELVRRAAAYHEDIRGTRPCSRRPYRGPVLRDRT
jgi:hypothetical protein